MKNTYDVIVIGGGASGMMAAGRAGERGKKVLLLEKNKTLGVKLSITGGGRCNICNAEEDTHRLLEQYGKAKKFLYSSFSRFGVAQTFSFFESRGLPLKKEMLKRVFPQSEQAQDVVTVLERYMHHSHVEIFKDARVEGFAITSGYITGVRVGGRTISATSYILATGGKSHPETGSTGDGFTWLRTLGHEVKDPTPSVVPLAVREHWIKSLKGKSLQDAKITFFVDGKKQFAVKGNILCTHFGISGPVILNVAGRVAHMLEEGVVTATIDAFPEFDLGAFDAHVREIFYENKNRELKNVLKLVTPQGTSLAILNLLPEIDPEKKIHNVYKNERKKIVHLLKALPITILGLMGYDRAVIVDGGLTLSEVDGKTMRSRKFTNLYIVGDVLNISRPSGGFSLQLCWTSGWVAGDHV